MYEAYTGMMGSLNRVEQLEQSQYNTKGTHSIALN